MSRIYAKAVMAGLRAYKLTLSPFIGQACRFLPTCSEYTAQAMIVHGPVKGSWMGVKRICRCRPGGGHGYDPVPPKSET
ncbi:membrane protein insertion efficiency factor YidD [Asticcacaulis sp. BYS171W]|uniref:Putative membrane protein insertion efficiency factor n=1 Tax=Asticcacaulis aquaticus TaxID=2984212 RepID=A0ABT5HQR8_9CAUL|nr:membrane protein insertion efficiency factor YidD [Asticcacaulis aquaticus]MDC7682423.1 membrane protein insertion efficiency factor YidD [Asticcacaulis aquaticus]